MRKAIMLSIAAAIAAAIVVGVVLANTAAPGHHPSTRVNLHIFEQPQRPSDRLPVAFRNGPVGAHFRSSDSRRLGTYRGTTWYAVPGVHHTICLAGIKDGQTFGPCRDADALSWSAIWMARATGPIQGGKHFNVAGIVTDGFTRIRWWGGGKKGMKDIHRNAFFITVPRGEGPVTMRTTGPDVEPHNLPLGNLPLPLKQR
jgi:hypothetical protein